MKNFEFLLFLDTQKFLKQKQKWSEWNGR